MDGDQLHSISAEGRMSRDESSSYNGRGSDGHLWPATAGAFPGEADRSQRGKREGLGFRVTSGKSPLKCSEFVLHLKTGMVSVLLSRVSRRIKREAYKTLAWFWHS